MTVKRTLIGMVVGFSCALAAATELVVPFNAGGVIDFFGRSVQKSLVANTDSNVAVVNKPGADGLVGIQYTLQKSETAPVMMVVSTGTVFRGVLYNNPGFRPNDFEILAPMAKAISVFVVSNRLGIKTFDDLISLAKVRSLNCGTSNPASSFVAQHVFKDLGLSNISVVGYKGSSDVAMQLLGEHIDCAIDPLPMYLSYFKDKRVQILALSDTSSDATVNKIPTIDQYVKGASFTHWFGVAIPKKSQSRIDAKIKDALLNLSKDPDFVHAMVNSNFSVTKPAADGERFYNEELSRYEKIRINIGIPKTQ